MSDGARTAVSHADIMAQLHQIDDRLRDGDDRFGSLEQAVKPIGQLVHAVGGEEQFQKIVIEAARTLAALAVIGTGAAALAKWMAVIGGGFVALGLGLKWLAWGWWQ